MATCRVSISEFASILSVMVLMSTVTTLASEGAVAYYADLSPCEYFGRWREVLIAVGWLEQGHSFATGKVSKEFLAHLISLLKDPWQPAVAAGFHRCALCRNTGERNTIVAGTANLFIPARAGIYVVIW